MTETQDNPSLYIQLKRAGCTISSHQSDLYVLATPEAVAIVQAAARVSGGTVRSTKFKSEGDGQAWLEVPFHYDPYWATRSIKAPSDPDAIWEIEGTLEDKTIWRRGDVFYYSRSEDDVEQPAGFHGRPVNSGFPGIVELATALGMDYDNFVPSHGNRQAPSLSP